MPKRLRCFLADRPEAVTALTTIFLEEIEWLLCDAAGVSRAKNAPPSAPIRKILTHVGEPLEPPPLAPARGPPTDWGELVQVHDDRDVVQATPDELPMIDIHSR